MEGTTHGCGVKLWKEDDQGFSVKEGKFLAGEYIGPVLTCSADASHSTAVEADYAAALARSLQVSLDAHSCCCSRPASLWCGRRTITGVQPVWQLPMQPIA
jgi:hypothetical protein